MTMMMLVMMMVMVVMVVVEVVTMIIIVSTTTNFTCVTFAQSEPKRRRSQSRTIISTVPTHARDHPPPVITKRPYN
jgi:hypothetical protein